MQSQRTFLLKCAAGQVHGVAASVWLRAQERCARHAMAQHFSGGSPAGRGRARSKGDGWRRGDSCAGLSRDECSLMRRWLVFTLRRLQDPGAGVYLDALEISRRDEISKWSTCLKMRGIPRGWARARGYESSTPCTWCGDREGGAGPARANRTLGRA